MIFSFKTNDQLIRKQVECPCKGVYNYHCNEGYCAINKRACDLFPKMKSRSDARAYGIDWCKKVKPKQL